MTVLEIPAPALEIILFGPMQVRLAGEPMPRVRSKQALWLLALLTLRHCRPVQREWLAGTLWPDSDASPAFSNLRVVLSELRSVLGDEGARLQTPSRHTLVLNLEGADVDLLAFDAACAGKSSDVLEQTVELYCGPLLEGCAEEWVFQERQQREQNCLRALETLAEGAHESGDINTAIRHWRRALHLDPLGEVVLRSLIEALARSGDSNAALQEYRDFTVLLQRSDPRASPDEETTALYRRLRKQVREKAAATDSHAKEEALAPLVSGSLNQAPTELVGREDERLEVAERLSRARLVTLTGPGGIGKTRLAVAVAEEVIREYPHGVWLVPLEALAAAGGDSDGGRDAGLALVQQIASVLDVQGTARAPILTTVTEHLRKKRLLLVLDNCEHVIDPCSEVAAHLLRECPGLRILATSRETLRVRGEIVWSVPALPTPNPDHFPSGGSSLARALSGLDAIRLFAQRAEAIDKKFALTSGNARAVDLLCARLDGIPLAIELAAARAGVLTPAQVLEQLEAQPLDALSSGYRDTAPRHRTLRATLQWSYGLLPVEAQDFLADLGVFRVGFTLEAAQAVCTHADVLEMLTVLQEASLVNVANVADGGTESRFALLETVRQFALDALERTGRATTVRLRHAHSYHA
jgi:predicted ATPase/DNA-binding SARP family transcriptional activator